MRTMMLGIAVGALLLLPTEESVAGQSGLGANHHILNARLFPKLSEPELNLLAEYLRSYHKLKSFYQNAQITANQREYRLTQPDKAPEKPSTNTLALVLDIDWEYTARDGKFFRLDSVIHEANNPSALVKRGAFIVRPEESYRLGYDIDTNKYFLKSHKKQFDQELDVIASFTFPFAPFLDGGAALLENVVFTPRSNASVESVKDTGDDEVTIVINSKNERGFASSSIQLWKSRCWAVKRIDSSSETESSDPGGPIVANRTYECSYNGDRDGVPLLQRVVSLTISGHKESSDVQPRFKRVSEIKDIVPEKGDVDVFNVNRLMPTLDRVGERPASWTRWVLLINGIALLIVGFVASIWFGKKQRSGQK